MHEYGYIAHHGVKGQKWGVRKQKPSSGNKRVSSPNKPSPDKRKAIALGVIGAIGAASLIGGGVAVAKNPEAVGRALTSIGGAFAKAPKQKIFAKTSKSIGKANAKASAKFIRKELRKKAVKEAPKKVASTVKKYGSQTAKGVIKGFVGAAKEMATEEWIKDTISQGFKQGGKTAIGAGIAGGVALGIKTAISGKKPTRQEYASYLTKNPNKKGK